MNEASLWAIIGVALGGGINLVSQYILESAKHRNLIGTKRLERLEELMLSGGLDVLSSWLKDATERDGKDSVSAAVTTPPYSVASRMDLVFRKSWRRRLEYVFSAIKSEGETSGHMTMDTRRAIESLHREVEYYILKVNARLDPSCVILLWWRIYSRFRFRL